MSGDGGTLILRDDGIVCALNIAILNPIAEIARMEAKPARTAINHSGSLIAFDIQSSELRLYRLRDAFELVCTVPHKCRIVSMHFHKRTLHLLIKKPDSPLSTNAVLYEGQIVETEVTHQTEPKISAFSRDGSMLGHVYKKSDGSNKLNIKVFRKLAHSDFY